MSSSTVPAAAVLTVLSNAVALAVAFGVPISNAEREALLAFFGSVSSLVFVVVAAWHAHSLAQAVKLVAGSGASSKSSTSSGA